MQVRLSLSLAARLLTLSVALASVSFSSGLSAQGPVASLDGRLPRFLRADGRAPVLLDINQSPVLKRRIALDLRDVTLEEALRTISLKSGLNLAYSKAVVALDRPVRLRAEDITVAGALSAVLLNAGVDVLFSGGSQATLVRRDGKPTQAAVGVVSGRVIDSASRAGIPDATVSVDGTRLSARTNQDGVYAIAVPAGAQSITVRRLGYAVRKRTVTVGDNATATLDFVLSRAPTTLDEMVVTATGDRRRLEVGNAIGTIKADSIVPVTLLRNMSDLLTARVPGVVVSNSTGLEGAPSIVRIRGTTSVNLSNDPIIILDGVRLAPANNAGLATKVGINTNISAPTGANNQSNAQVTARLDDIDPNTIESIDVLRGPSASSLYGTDAANGVIVIKTKQGRTGGYRANILADYGLSYLPHGVLPAQTVVYGHDADGTPDLQCFWYLQLDGGCVQDSVRTYNPLTDPRLTTFGTGRAQSVSGSVSGGTERLREFLSVKASNATGLVKLSDAELDRVGRMWNETVPDWIRHPNGEQNISGGSRTSLQVGRAFDLAFNINGIYRNTLEAGDGSLLSNSPDINGVPTNTARYYAGDTLINLPAEQMRARMATVAKRGFVTAQANYTPLSWLAFRGTLGGDYTLRTDESLLRAQDCTVELNPSGCRSGHESSRGETFVTTADLGAQATWNPKRWVSLRTNVGQQLGRTKFYGLAASNGFQSNLAYGTELLTPTPVATVTGGTQILVTERREESAIAGRYIEETVGLRDKLYITGAVRQDLASAFGRNVNKSRPPLFPKLSVSWLASEEPFFPKTSRVSSLRFRAAVGQSGLEARQIAVQNNFSRLDGFVDGSVAQAIILTSFGNPDLRPERANEVEGGFDLSLLTNERVHLEVTMYRKRTRDALNSRTFSASVGGGSQTFNMGAVENRGVEVTASARLLDARRAAWDLTVNASSNRNRWVSANPTLATANSPPFVGGSNINVVGYPLRSFFDRPIIGYYDANGDGVLSFNELQFAPRLRYIGSANPAAEITYSNALRFLGGKLAVNANFNEVVGKSLGNRTDIAVGGTPILVLYQPGSIGEQAQVLESKYVGPFFGKKANTLRFSELSITGTLPDRYASRVFRARNGALTLAARNLAHWSSSNLKETDYTGSETFVRALNTGPTNGFAIPQPRQWTLRINLGY